MDKGKITTFKVKVPKYETVVVGEKEVDNYRTTDGAEFTHISEAREWQDKLDEQEKQRNYEREKREIQAKYHITIIENCDGDSIDIGYFNSQEDIHSYCSYRGYDEVYNVASLIFPCWVVIEPLCGDAEQAFIRECKTLENNLIEYLKKLQAIIR